MASVRQEPLVSVIVIFRDAARFLLEAIESAFSQTYREWELVLVDDGSTDGSGDIARRQVARDPTRVRYLTHSGGSNRGMSASRNLGVHGSRGMYVAFLDADDVWLPHKLSEQVALLESKSEVGMVYGAALYWFSWSGDSANGDFVRQLGVEPNTIISPPSLLTLSLRSEAPTPCPSDILVRRAAVEGVGGFENAFTGLFEDQVFLSKLYLREKVYVAGQTWIRYRRHAQSSMAVSGAGAGRYRAGLDYLDWLAAHLADSGVGDEEVRRALRGKRDRYRRELSRRRFRGFVGRFRGTRAADRGHR